MRNKKKTRKSKIEATENNNVKNNSPLSPLNDTQSKYIRAIENNDLIIAFGPAGTAKAQPLYSKVLTPSGWKTMGSLKSGDLVICPDGSEVSVLSVYPQGVKNIYEVTFKNGSKVHCCGDHLWKVNLRPYKLSGFEKVLDTKTLKLLLNCNVKLSTPICKPIVKSKKDLPLDPYLLGVLIGDGGLTIKTSFSTADEEIFHKIEKIVEKYHCTCVKTPSQKYEYSILGKGRGHKNPITEILRQLNLFGKKSQEKHIPKCYLDSCIEDRLELLRGLMDTDGSVDKNNNLSYCTASENLAEDFYTLSRELGFYAKKSKQKGNKYKVTSGEIKIGRPHYKLYLSSNNNKELFSLSRKKIRCKETYYGGQKELDNQIYNIEHVGEEECQCILIDHPDHLYITDGYEVTHNTYIPAVMACDNLTRNLIKKVVICRPTEGPGRALGTLPGTKDEKLESWMAPVLETMRKRLGPGAFNHAFKNQSIELCSLQQIKGRSFKDTYIIADEAEDIDIETMKSLVTRLDHGTKLIVNGDINQKHIKQSSGLSYLLGLAKKYQLPVAIIEFTSDDCVRGRVTKMFVKIFEKEKEQEEEFMKGKTK